MRNDDGAGGDFERGFRGLQTGMRKIDQDTQPIAILYDGRPEWR